MKYTIQHIEDEDSQKILNIINRFWNEAFVVIHGKIFYPTQLLGIKAVHKDRIIGILHYLIQDDICEIVTLASLSESQGIGKKLITTVEGIALYHHCERLQVTTSNDNLPALGLYQKLGFCLVQLKAGQMEESRKIKPSIPALGYRNIPIRDELILEKPLV